MIYLVWLFFQELNKLYVFSVCLLLYNSDPGLFVIASDAYCNFLIQIIKFSQSISRSSPLHTSCYQLAIDMRFSLLKFERLTNCWHPFVHTNRIVSLKLWLVAYNVGCFVNCSEQCLRHIMTLLKNIRIIL
jgi:hypothetical protein